MASMTIFLRLQDLRGGGVLGGEAAPRFPFPIGGGAATTSGKEGILEGRASLQTSRLRKSDYSARNASTGSSRAAYQAGYSDANKTISSVASDKAAKVPGTKRAYNVVLS